MENLRILCPNCNATLPTHCRGGKFLQKQKKKKEKRLTNKQIEEKINRRKINRPSYEQLVKEINELGYSATGRKYGVSDNAIRKWKIYYEKHGE